MTVAGAATFLAHAEELQRRDDELAAGIGEVAELLVRADAVHARAGAILALLDALPAEVARSEAAVAEATAREQRASDELVAARLRLDALPQDRRRAEEARAQARRELLRAGEELADASARTARLGARHDGLVASGATLQDEADELAAAAGEIAAVLRTVARVSESGREEPGPGLESLVEWGGRVRAALFVVRGGLESERERILVEAGTMGAAVLGEQVAGASVAAVRRRLAAHLQGA